MPYYRGLTVKIVSDVQDQPNTPLQEWGVRKPNPYLNTTEVTSYIESVSGLPFKVRIVPDLPFPFPEDLKESTPPPDVRSMLVKDFMSQATEGEQEQVDDYDEMSRVKDEPLDDFDKYDEMLRIMEEQVDDGDHVSGSEGTAHDSDYVNDEFDELMNITHHDSHGESVHRIHHEPTMPDDSSRALDTVGGFEFKDFTEQTDTNAIDLAEDNDCDSEMSSDDAFPATLQQKINASISHNHKMVHTPLSDTFDSPMQTTFDDAYNIKSEMSSNIFKTTLHQNVNPSVSPDQKLASTPFSDTFHSPMQTRFGEDTHSDGFSTSSTQFADHGSNHTSDFSGRGSSNARTDPSPDSTQQPFWIPYIPYHLLVRVYLDGRDTYENQKFIILDPNHPDFRWCADGIEVAEGYARNSHGRALIRKWKFQEVGIESILQSLHFGNEPAVAQTAEDDLVDAFTSAGLDDAPETAKVGQIKVSFHRVRLHQEKWHLPEHINSYRPSLANDDDADAEAEGPAAMGAVDNVSHTAAYTEPHTLPSNPVRCLHYTPYIPGEPPFASFTFFYRSRDILRKFRFPGFPQEQEGEGEEPVPARRRARLNERMAALTPISISNGAAMLKAKRQREMERESGGAGLENMSLGKRFRSAPEEDEDESDGEDGAGEGEGGGVEHGSPGKRVKRYGLKLQTGAVAGV